MNRRSTGDFLGSETLLCDTIMEDTCHMYLLKPTKCVRPRVNPNVNYRLWVIGVCTGSPVIMYHSGGRC
jgi:hypothetical protein